MRNFGIKDNKCQGYTTQVALNDPWAYYQVHVL